MAQYFGTRERIKSKEEVKTKDKKVQSKIIDIKGEQKKGHSKGTEVCQAVKRQRQLHAQEEFLSLSAPEVEMATLRERRVSGVRLNHGLSGNANTTKTHVQIQT